jgi:hypothetical protein
VWAAQALLIAFALKLKVSSALADADMPTNGRAFQVGSCPPSQCLWMDLLDAWRIRLAQSQF